MNMKKEINMKKGINIKREIEFEVKEKNFSIYSLSGVDRNSLSMEIQKLLKRKGIEWIEVDLTRGKMKTREEKKEEDNE